MRPDAGIYVGLFLTAVSTLMFEIVLTRIFSVTMWYHFAFMAISIAMFGMTVGAIIVYLFPSVFTSTTIQRNLTLSALLFASSIVASVLVHLNVPFITAGKWETSLAHVVITYIVIAIPFVFSGIAACLSLTKFERDVGKLYAADLLGAGSGCLILVPLLSVADGPSTVIIIASVAALGGLFYSWTGSSKNLRVLASILTVLLLSVGVANAALYPTHQQFIKLRWVHGSLEEMPIYEKWNAFSRIKVHGDPKELHRPCAWGLSRQWPSDKKVSELDLTIDAGADTVLTAFNGDFSKVAYLEYDLTNLVHFIRPDGKMLIIGIGGGRDLLSALKFPHKSVDAVEINSNIIDSLTRVFGDYTGHLDRYPNVRIFNDEGRGFLAKSKDKYDVIQISLIDTLTASSAGAYVFTEHSLYTVQAWRLFLTHLNPDGVLTVSRWYFKKRPGEILRLVNLAVSALDAAGEKDPIKHIILLATMGGANGGRADDGIGTLLVSREPFSDHDVEAVNKFAHKLGFEVILTPQFAANTLAGQIAQGGPASQDVIASYPLNISAPTDDTPFFLHMLRLKDALNIGFWNQGVMSSNALAIGILWILLATVIVLSTLCIVIPLILSKAPERKLLIGAPPLLIYFGCIGLGFMFIEISQMQRLVVFLGQPVYALSVVLFTLLLASGAGSLSTAMIGKVSPQSRLLTLLAVLSLFGLLTPWMVSVLDTAGTSLKILASISILFPLGFFMGMAFPIGMNAALSSSKELTPWLWGINGALSVCASVFAVAIALSFGISATFWTGVGCYCAATASYLLIKNKGQ